ncbi:DUF2020 domain-containing protein [Amycolatopsis nigrescens]|uniref:DUF2020 domain-containing protein n=1 Tax=Amycolatopsis nigrescens TaxID=381445 RepID=UPI0003AB2B2A|nr:DUF2020 domain-containing protein [Amycolatopsis nigrescens]
MAGLTGCAQPEPGSQPSAPPPSPPAAAQPPPDPEPAAPGPCPYLDDTFVERANGQKVSKVRKSADEPHPACFFYALNGKLQLTVRVYVGEAPVAKALVDKVAPVDTSNPADEPAGWQGGYQSTGTDGSADIAGAVYAVAKQGNAVVATTNQEQTVKARTVVKQVITALGL